MNFSFLFFFNSILLGFGLAMDAFSVSVANGLNQPDMKKLMMCLVAGTYSFFQFIMPLAGWICIRTVAERFSLFQKFIPYIALALLLYIGMEMIFAVTGKAEKERKKTELNFIRLAVQGVATSIDALSAGFAISEYAPPMALLASVIIAAVTFILSFTGLVLGRRLGVRFADRASIAGGVILIGIGVEIFVRGVFFA